MSVIKIKAVDQALIITNAPMISAGDVKTDYIIFTFDSAWDGFTKTAVFYRDDNKEDIYEVALDNNNKAVVPHEVTAANGKIWICVVGVKTNGNIFTSESIWYAIVDGVYTGAMVSRSAEASTYLRILEIVYELRAMVGSPLVANTSAGMTDETKIYVYTGSETGYTAGNWYYFDGSAWVSGGIYNSNGVETDKTLTVSGMAADSAAVGDRFDSVENILTKADIGTWERGTLDSGGRKQNSDRRIRLQDRVKFITEQTFTINSGYKMMVFYYASPDSTYRDNTRPDGGVTEWLTGSSFTVEAGTWVNILITQVNEIGAYPPINEFTDNVYVNIGSPITFAVRELQNEQAKDENTRELVTAEIGRNLPDYWETYLNTKNASILEELISIGNHGDVFVFFTDYHYDPNSDFNSYGFSYLPDIIRELGVKKVVFGGDILQQHTKARALEIYQQYQRDFGKFEIYNVVGNHETNPYAESAEHFTESNIYEILFREMGMENRANLEAGMYYYFDNKPMKIRYICLNTHSTGAEWTSDATQHQWIVNTLLNTPYNYHVVVIPHMFFGLTNNNTQITVSSIGTSIKTIVDAYANKGVGTWNGVAYDFSNCGGVVACILTGHTHNDYSMVSGAGYPIIGTICDAEWGSNQNVTGVTRGTAVRGTTGEHAFDIMCIDTAARTIKAVRIGYGNDRTWSY